MEPSQSTPERSARSTAKVEDHSLQTGVLGSRTLQRNQQGLRRLNLGFICSFTSTRWVTLGSILVMNKDDLRICQIISDHDMYIFQH